ncbi:hypothetical protein [Sinomicrobium soli]|uniref:hypothetical protein n=1 Tax=Sinomicrobium sp. N-1-3-6 TaxID=2219864 RepID=UPI000DCB90E3|nr:hypothetical protein [Sinomicrobium sp. N-1-3-6]RAV30746.1 hypothetical protein DN748_00350 [Sinomicrobium sp. N-1-3-6]
MKKLLTLAIALTLVSGIMAQEKGERRGMEKKKERISHFKDLTPGQLAALQTKRMALKLDLDASQQEEVLKLNTELAEKRKSRMEAFKKADKSVKKEWSSEDRFAFMNTQLDAQLEVQNRMKDILNDDQYDQWKKDQHKRSFKRHYAFKHRKSMPHKK